MESKIMSSSQELIEALTKKENEKGFSTSIKLMDLISQNFVNFAISKRLIIRHFQGKGNNVYFADLHGNAVNTPTLFQQVDTIVFCNGNMTDFHGPSVDLFDHQIPVSIGVGASVELRLSYNSGSMYRFYRESSFTFWGARDISLIADASAVLLIPLFQ